MYTWTNVSSNSKIKNQQITEYEKEIPRVAQYLLPLGTKVKESVKNIYI